MRVLRSGGVEWRERKKLDVGIPGAGVLGDGYFQHWGVFGFDQLRLRGKFTTQKRYFLPITEFLVVHLLKGSRVGPITGFKF